METTKQLMDLLDYVGEKFEMAVDWSQTEIMPYLKQLADNIVNYKRQIAIMWIIAGIVLLILFIAFEIIAKAQSSEGYFYMGWAAAVIGAIIIIYNCYTVIACNTFPEKVVLDYIQEVNNSYN